MSNVPTTSKKATTPKKAPVYSAEQMQDLRNLAARFASGELTAEQYATENTRIRRGAKTTTAKAPLNKIERITRINGVTVAHSESGSTRNETEFTLHRIETALRKKQAINNGQLGDVRYKLDKSGKLSVQKTGADALHYQLASAEDAKQLLLA